MNITGAIFDSDGTLVDSLQVWCVIWNNLGTPVEITGVFEDTPLACRPPEITVLKPLEFLMPHTQTNNR